MSLDDGPYVTDNPEVRAGLGWAGVRWAATTTREAKWHPLYPHPGRASVAAVLSAALLAALSLAALSVARSRPYGDGPGKSAEARDELRAALRLSPD